MEIKTVNRTIRPATHKSESPYRVKIGKRNFYDLLVVNIFHEKLGKVGSFEFNGKEIAPYESIHLKPGNAMDALKSNGCKTWRLKRWFYE